MKKIILFLSVFTFLLIFSYIIGSFVNASFDISSWSFDFRAPFGIISGIFSLLISCAVTDMTKYE